MARNWFVASGDTNADRHIIILSDGQPSQPGGSNNARTQAIIAATGAKNAGIEIFTI